DNAMAQELLYMSIGTGILEMNSRGQGFINYRYL
ncbi:MAG TPA: CRISPR-associated endoribonuclease Cas6, partial [Clostridium sp.]|nr:CRISPR-associated endoribonuclease Cas6 [Clostridium sp.]